MNKNRKKSKLKLWRYKCSYCGNKDNTVERAELMPIGVKLCHKCGHTMYPKETYINLNNKHIGSLTIKL